MSGFLINLEYPVKEGELDNFAREYEKGPFAFLSKLPDCLSYDACVDTENNKMFAAIKFTSAEVWKAAFSGPEFDGFKKTMMPMMAGPPSKK